MPTTDRNPSTVRRPVPWVRGLILAGVGGLTLWHDLRAPDRREARAAYARGDVPTALRRALDRLDRHPRDGDAAWIAARCYSQLIHADEAGPYCEAAARAADLSTDDLQVRALGLPRSNRSEQAIAAYEEILRRDPENPTALQRLAAVRWLRSEIKQALDLAGRLSRIPSHAAVGHVMLAEIHHDPNRSPDRLEDPAAPSGSRRRRLQTGPRTRPGVEVHPSCQAHLLEQLRRRPAHARPQPGGPPLPVEGGR